MTSTLRCNASDLIKGRPHKQVEHLKLSWDGPLARAVWLLAAEWNV